MNPDTGAIHFFDNEEVRESYEKSIGRKLVPLTDKKAKELLPLSNRKRKALLRGMSCPCASGKSFKKCCWKKYQKKLEK